MRFQLDRIEDQLTLVPFDEAAIRTLDIFVEAGQIGGEPVEVEILNPRDMVEHRRIMAQIGDLAKALHKTHEQVRAELLYATGNFAVIGEIVGLPPVIAVNSMSRHAMTDHELHLFWDEARPVIESRLLPRIADTAERERLAGMLSREPAV
jgi:hypothetical protein